MAGKPWEKYAAQPQGVAPAGPWAKYAGPTKANAEAAGLPPSLAEGQQQAGAAGVGEQVPSTAQGLYDRILNGITMGYGDEVEALDSAILGRTADGGMFNYDQPFSERYNTALGAHRQQRENFRESSNLGGVAEVAGALAGVGGLAKQGVTLVGRAATNAGRVGAGAAEGAAYGGLYGSGEATEGNRLEGGLYGAATGALTGAALTGVGNKIADAVTKRAATKAAPTTEALKDASSALYKTARDQDVIYGAPAWQNMLKGLETELAGEAFDKGLHPNAARVLERMREIPAGTGVTLPGAEVYRKLIAAAGNPQNPSEGRLLGMMRDRLDDFITDPANVAAVKGDEKVAMGALQEARALWGNAKRGEVIEGAIEAAKLRAGSTYSGGNIENALRQEFKKIIAPKSKLGRGFSEAERAAIREFVTGGSDITRVLAKLSPQGSGLMSALGIGGVAAGGPLMAAVPAAGMVAKSLRDRGAQSGAEALGAMTRSRGVVPPQVPPYLLAPDKRAMVARLLAAEGGGATGSAMTAPAQ